MKFRNEITIDADQDTVWRMFADPDNLRLWQPALKSVRHLAGTPGEPGAMSEFVYRERGRDVTLTETITECRSPHFQAGIYESAAGMAVVVNHFEPAGDQRTRWVAYANHRFSGAMRYLGLLFRGSMRNRTRTSMQQFKLLVETRLAERSS
jgi:uncharacterized membrane protein